MDSPTIAEFLTYVPPEAIKRSRFPSSTRTTKPSRPRDLNGVEVRWWTTFPQSVRDTRRKVLSKASQQKLPISIDRATVRCANESQVEFALNVEIFEPLKTILRHLGIAGDFQVRPSEVILDPDFSWGTEEKPPSDIWDPKILIEVKTFWALDLRDDLLENLDPENSSAEEKKIWCGVAQICGYMTVNNMRYGVLGTYNKFIFLRRDESSSSQSKLEITRVIRREQTRETDDFTLMEAWITLIMAADKDSVFCSPYKSPDPPEQMCSIKDPMELSTEFKLGDLWFGRRRIRSQLGTIVNGGLRNLKPEESVMKIVDKSKSPEMSEKLEHEVSGYKRMLAVRNIVAVRNIAVKNIVPKVEGFLLISDWMMVLILSNCGNEISSQEFLAHYEHIERMVRDIHETGVVHRDLRCANIMIDASDHLTIIDFSECVLRGDVDKRTFDDFCATDLEDLKRVKKSCGRQ